MRVQFSFLTSLGPEIWLPLPYAAQTTFSNIFFLFLDFASVCDGNASRKKDGRDFLRRGSTFFDSFLAALWEFFSCNRFRAKNWRKTWFLYGTRVPTPTLTPDFINLDSRRGQDYVVFSNTYVLSLFGCCHFFHSHFSLLFRSTQISPPHPQLPYQNIKICLR